MLKPSALERALADAGIEIETSLRRSHSGLFDAFFWPPTPNVPYERLYVRAETVPSERAAEARRKIEDAALPALIKWIADILARDRNSPVRREEQRVVFGPL